MRGPLLDPMNQENENDRNTISKDGAWNEEDGVTLEEGEIVEEEENNTKVKETSDENEELCAMDGVKEYSGDESMCGAARSQNETSDNNIEKEITDMEGLYDNSINEENEEEEVPLSYNPYISVGSSSILLAIVSF